MFVCGLPCFCSELLLSADPPLSLLVAVSTHVFCATLSPSSSSLSVSEPSSCLCIHSKFIVPPSLSLSDDHTRVRLRNKGPANNKDDEYINANFVDGFRRPRAYICTQVIDYYQAPKAS